MDDKKIIVDERNYDSFRYGYENYVELWSYILKTLHDDIYRCEQDLEFCELDDKTAICNQCMIHDRKILLNLFISKLNELKKRNTNDNK